MLADRKQRKKQPLRPPKNNGRTMLMWATLLLLGLHVGNTWAGVEAMFGSNGSGTIDCLKKARIKEPSNFAIPFYLGQLYLQLGEVDPAIAEWEKYLTMAPEDSKAIAVKERLTVLKIASAEAFAKKAVSRKGALSTTLKAPENSMAVIDFKNKSGPSYSPFVKGMTAMIMTDLSKVPQLKIVEREKINAIMQEMQLSKDRVVDPKTTATMGRLLMARKITSGSMDVDNKMDLSVVAMISDVELAKSMGDTKIKGSPQKFFELEKEVVLGILKILHLSEKMLDPKVVVQIRKVHTKDMDALTYYGEGLIHLDNKEFDQAGAAFEKAIQIDPHFDLAVEAFRSTPKTRLSAHDLIRDSRIVSGPVALDLREPTAETAEASIVGSEMPNDLPEKIRYVSYVDSIQHAAEIARISHIKQIQSQTQQPEPIPEPTPEPTPEPSPEPSPEPTPGPTPEPTPPTANLGFAIAMVDQTATFQGPDGLPTYETLLSGIYRNPSIQDLSQSVIFNGISDGQVTLNGNTSQVTDYQSQSGSALPTSLPYDVIFTSMGFNNYLEWGYWLGNDQTPMTNGVDNDYTISSHGYFVQGDPTTNSQMSQLGLNNITATYSGNAYATLWTSSGGSNITGSFNAEVAFQNGQITNFNLAMNDIPGSTASIVGANGNFLSGTPGFTINPNSGTWNINSGVAFTRDAHGAVYGPNAEHMGGTVAMQTSAYSMNGVFAGTR